MVHRDRRLVEMGDLCMVLESGLIPEAFWHKMMLSISRPRPAEDWLRLERFLSEDGTIVRLYENEVVVVARWTDEDAEQH